MSENGPYFYAWCEDADIVDAFASSISALIMPGTLCKVDIHPLGGRDMSSDRVYVDEAIVFLRSHFTANAVAHVNLSIDRRFRDHLNMCIDCHGHVYRQRYLMEPIRTSVYDLTYFFLRQEEWPYDAGPRSTAVEAASMCLGEQADTETIVLGLCAPDNHKRVLTGGCSFGYPWDAPVETSVTCHSEASTVVRDLLLSWVHIHDGYKVLFIAGQSIEALAARVDAAPPDTRVGVARSLANLQKYLKHDWVSPPPRDSRWTRPELARIGPRVFLPGAHELTREQVLAAVATPPATLLDALEAAAVPDDEWRAAEPLALEMIEAKKQGAPTLEIDVSTGHHVRFIERHAPYHVRRLPNGGVMLATHPYRTLWPLWADALHLLGIRPADT